MALKKREFVNNSKPPIDADFLNELQDAVIDLELNGGGGSGSGTGAVEIEEATYENLSEEEKMADVLYMVKDGTPEQNKAVNIKYDNTESGLEATNLQGAVDELSDNSEWKLVGSAKGLTAITLPTNAKEIYIESTYSTATFTFNLPYKSLTSTTKTIRDGAFLGNSYGGYAIGITVTNTSVSLAHFFSVGTASPFTSTNVKDDTTTTVYYR